MGGMKNARDETKTIWNASSFPSGVDEMRCARGSYPWADGDGPGEYGNGGKKVP